MKHKDTFKVELDTLTEERMIYETEQLSSSSCQSLSFSRVLLLQCFFFFFCFGGRGGGCYDMCVYCTVTKHQQKTKHNTFVAQKREKKLNIQMSTEKKKDLVMIRRGT